MCAPPHTEKSPLLGLQFISSPLPTRHLPNRTSQTTPTTRHHHHQQRQQEQMQNERRQLLYLVFLLAVLLLAAPLFCFIKESADRLFGSDGRVDRADESLHQINVLTKTNTSPLLRLSSPSELSALEEESSTSSSSLSLSLTNRKKSFIQLQTQSPNATSSG
eukprot:scaffold6619_cov146-Skeletonema_menzelii.AAC.3